MHTFFRLLVTHECCYSELGGTGTGCLFQFTYCGNIIPYFCRKSGKVLQNLSPAAFVIGALRVDHVLLNPYISFLANGVDPDQLVPKEAI